MKTLIVMTTGEIGLIDENIHKVYDTLKEWNAISINDSVYLWIDHLLCLFDWNILYRKNNDGDFTCVI